MAPSRGPGNHTLIKGSRGPAQARLSPRPPFRRSTERTVALGAKMGKVREAGQEGNDGEAGKWGFGGPSPPRHGVMSPLVLFGKYLFDSGERFAGSWVSIFPSPVFTGLLCWVCQSRGVTGTGC